MVKRSPHRFGTILAFALLLSAVLAPASPAGVSAAADDSRAAASPSMGSAGAASGLCPVYYTVKRGDNLTRIAARYGVTIWQLQRWNRIPNINRIYVGQRLIVYYRACGQQSPTPTPAPAGSWLGTYFNNRDLAGPAALERREGNLNYNWGFSSPAPQVFPDNFSVRWNRTFSMAGGTYRIAVRSDDGIRVYVDGVLVIDAWSVHPVTHYSVDVVIVGGNRTFTVEYFEAEGLADVGISVKKL